MIIFETKTTHELHGTIAKRYETDGYVIYTKYIRTPIESGSAHGDNNIYCVRRGIVADCF